MSNHQHNPFQPPETAPQPEQDSPSAKSPSPLAKAVGSFVLFSGIALIGYGALAFWAIPTLPPNGGPQGRLPSLYVVGVGIAMTLVGLVIRQFVEQSPSKKNDSKGIPTAYGLFGLFLILLIAGYLISRL